MKRIALTAALAIALTEGIAENSNGVNTSNFCDCQGVGIQHVIAKPVVPPNEPVKPRQAETAPGIVKAADFLIQLWFSLGIL